jgi:GDP-L-fucose synthase
MQTVVVTGGTGLVGGALKRISEKYNYNWIFLSSKDCDLTSYEETYRCWSKLNPDVVIHLAANVGGLFKNMEQKVDMFETNMLINMNVVKVSHLVGVKKLVGCLSTCIFPDKTEYPIDETMLHSGPPHNSNDAYSYAKRMLDVLCQAYREQYGCNYVTIIPTNIYGPCDNYNLKNGHVVPALIHKCYLAKKDGKPFVVYGSGKPLRQFIYSDDLAKLLMWVVDNYDEPDPIILSPDESDEISIHDVAVAVAEQFNYIDQMVFDETYADGQFRKTASNKKLRSLMKYDFNFTDIKIGMEKSVKWFVDNYEIARK